MSEEQHFLASVPASSSVEEATQVLVAISNLVTCCARLCKLGEQAVSGNADLYVFAGQQSWLLGLLKSIHP